MWGTVQGKSLTCSGESDFSWPIAHGSKISYSSHMSLIQGEPPTEKDTVAQLAHCIRLEREARSWSQADLAQHSGVSKAAVSKIERGEMSPTAGTLVRLAGAFDLTLAGLLLRAEGHTGRLVRAADQPRWRDPETGYERQQLVMRPDHPVEVVRVTLPQHQHVNLPASSYARIRQVVLVEAGTLTVQEGPERHELAAGDSLAFGPPHDVTFSNPAAQPCTYLVMLSRS
jgi:transcriptional regulator with XRE-family HTH domain